MKTETNWNFRLSTWLTKEAFPLWTTTGIDASTRTVWEALNHDGSPCADMNRRLRVQARQAYCFAQSQDPSQRAWALELFRFAMDQGFDAETGNLAARLSPDTSILTAPHDLYDVAFMLLASAALIEAGAEIDADLKKLEGALDRLKAPRGWFENAACDMPRRQNPHMHMFEASTALFKGTAAPRFKAMADECLGLFKDVFLQDDGRVFEYFSEDWSPLPADEQVIEPGHMAEWIYLLDRYQTVTGEGCGVNFQLLFDAVLARRERAGLLPDRSDPPSGTRRMWPQTEFLKASLAMQRLGLLQDNAPQPAEILAAMWKDYLEVPVNGGWYDKRDENGALVSTNMPASTFYHILVAFQMFLESETS